MQRERNSSVWGSGRRLQEEVEFGWRLEEQVEFGGNRENMPRVEEAVGRTNKLCGALNQSAV